MPETFNSERKGPNNYFLIGLAEGFNNQNFKSIVPKLEKFYYHIRAECMYFRHQICQGMVVDDRFFNYAFDNPYVIDASTNYDVPAPTQSEGDKTPQRKPKGEGSEASDDSMNGSGSNDRNEAEDAEDEQSEDVPMNEAGEAKENAEDDTMTEDS